MKHQLTDNAKGNYDDYWRSYTFNKWAWIRVVNKYQMTPLVLGVCLDPGFHFQLNCQKQTHLQLITFKNSNFKMYTFSYYRYLSLYACVFCWWSNSCSTIKNKLYIRTPGVCVYVENTLTLVCITFIVCVLRK